MEAIVDEPRADLSSWNVNKPLTRSQATHLKYKDIIVDGKITCELCNVTVKVMSYDAHLKSALHAIGKPSTDTFTCECGAVLNIRYKLHHENSQEHKYKIDKINKKDNKAIYKLETYEKYKDTLNCCCRCLKVAVPDCYFLKDSKLCICCDEILKRGEKRCRMCKEVKDIKDFERPYLFRCRKCASERL